MRAAVFSLLLTATAGEPRLVWSGPEVTLLGMPSRDGAYLSYVHEGNLALRDLASGKTSLLTHTPPGSSEFAYFSAISRDSTQVAYAWFNPQGFYDLRVVAAAGGEPRILYSNDQAGFVQPCAWSPDGTQILTLFFRKDNTSQIAVVPAQGGPPRILRSLNWVYPKRMDWSPDGKYIVYDSFQQADGGDRGVFLISADGSRSVPLAMGPGSHLFPLWSPRGDAVVYASEQEGGMEIRRQAVENGKPAGDPEVVWKGLERILPLGLTASGEYFYGVRTGLTDVFVTTLNAQAAEARRATLRFSGRNRAPAWSPDGNRLAYLSRRGSENFGTEARAIVIRSFDPEDEKEVLPHLAHMERLAWMPDGQHLLVSGSDNKGRAGVYQVKISDGSLTAVDVRPGADFRGVPAVAARAGIYRLTPEGHLRGPDGLLFKEERLTQLAARPGGETLALATSAELLLLHLADRRIQRIALPGIQDLDWQPDLIAQTPRGLYRIREENPSPESLVTPGNLLPGFSLHPDGKHIAVTAGRNGAEVRVLKLAVK